MIYQINIIKSPLLEFNHLKIAKSLANFLVINKKISLYQFKDHKVACLSHLVDCKVRSARQMVIVGIRIIKKFCKTTDQRKLLVSWGF